MSAARDRRRRHALIRDLVATYAVESQTELVQLLADQGVKATQATVSRDLDELGIGKLRGADGRVAYYPPDVGGLAQILRQFVLAIDHSGNLAVVRTLPGAASTVASALDQARPDGVLATLQGDDTILVVAKEPSTGSAIAAGLRTIKEQRP